MPNRLGLAAVLLVLLSGVALAQTTQPAGMPPAGTATEAGKNLKDWQVAKLAAVGAAQAIATAEKERQGGRAIDVDFKRADGKDPAHYSIKVVYPDGKLVEYGINADTGALFKTENQPVERFFTFLKPADFDRAKLSLTDALALAEKTAGGGRAFEAEVEREGKAVEYEIKVAGADREHEVKIGPDGSAKLDN